MIFVKSCVSMTTLVVIANKDFFSYLKVEGPDVKFLVTRVLFMVVGLSCLCYASLSIPQAFMSIGQNIAPLLMCIFSYIFLGEVLQPFVKTVIFFAFLGCSIIVYGNYLKDKENLSKSAAAAPILAWIAVLTNSTQSGASAIIMRKMKSIHWITLNIYLNILFITLSGGYLGLQLQPYLDVVSSFDAVSWFLIVVISWSEISNKSFRLMAFRYQNPG